MDEATFHGLLLSYDTSDGDKANKTRTVSIRFVVSAKDSLPLTDFLNDRLGTIDLYHKVGRFSLRWEHEQ